MKAICLFLTVFTLVSTAPILADECCATPAVNIQARMREIDTNILLMQYEQIQTELAKIDLQLLMMTSDESKSESDRQKEVQALNTRRAHFNEFKDSCVAKLEKLERIALASK
jgi:hypothetical protein